MKFYCDNCNTKYAIADEKVRGKVLKVRCKKCENVITVRANTAPAKTASPNQSSASAPPPAPAKSDPTSVPWHYSLNGQSSGPFPFATLAGRFASGELGDECYVWTDSFADWKPVRQVDAFADALRKGQQIKPRQKTMGVSQALEAVRPEDFERRQKEKQRAEEASSDQPASRKPGADPAANERSPADEPAKPASEQKESAREESEQKGAGQKDRLAKLRQRLKSESTPDKVEPASQPRPDGRSVEDELVADGGSSQGEARAAEQASAPHAGGTSDEADALGPTLPIERPEGGKDADEGEHSGLFQDFDPSRAGEPEREQDEPSDPEQSDHIPFFPDAPELSSEPGKVADSKSDSGDGITGSLLIQLDNIQKQGRGKKALLVAVALLVVGGLIGTGIYIRSQYQPEEPETQAKANPEADDDDELVIRTYGKDEQKKMLVLGNQHVGADEGKDDGSNDAEKGTDGKVEPRRMAQNSGSASKKLRGSEKKKESDNGLEDAFKSAKKKKSAKDSFRSGLDDGGLAKSNFDSPLVNEGSSLSTATATGSERQDAIYKPTDSIKKRKKASGGATKLTRKQISIGINTVRRSVGLCRERHSRRGQPLDARKIYVTLTVEPNGRVSSFDLAPDRVRHSQFERCMTSHRQRWKFPSFDGDAQKMRAPFVLD